MEKNKELKMYEELVNFANKQLDSAKRSDSPKFVEAYYLITRIRVNAFETYILLAEKDHYFKFVELIRKRIDSEFKEIFDKFNQPLEEIVK